MAIDKDHKYYGAVLLQIAEYSQFTAINAFRTSGRASRCSFVINNDIGIYVRYRSEVNPTRYLEYNFHFNENNLIELEGLAMRLHKVFIALVCDEAKEICCISHDQLIGLIADRNTAKGCEEDRYTILVTALPRESFRVYVNLPSERNKKLGEIIVPRNRFPKCLFA